MKDTIAHTHESIFFTLNSYIVPTFPSDLIECKHSPIDVIATIIKDFNKSFLIIGVLFIEYIGVYFLRLTRVETLWCIIEELDKCQVKIMFNRREEWKGVHDTATGWLLWYRQECCAGSPRSHTKLNDFA